MPTVYQSLAEQLEPVIKEIYEDIQAHPADPIEDILFRWLEHIQESILTELNCKGVEL